MNAEKAFLSHIRELWEAQDWESLVAMSSGPEFSSHPQRASLALIVALAYFNMQEQRKGEGLLEIASSWGCSPASIRTIQLACLDYSLGRAFLLIENLAKAELLFNQATSKVNKSLNEAGFPVLAHSPSWVGAAAGKGLFKFAGRQLENKLANLRHAKNRSSAEIKILSTEIEILSHELALAEQRGQVSGAQRSGPAQDTELARLKNQATSQLGQDLWVLEKSSFKHGGFFVEFGATDGVLLSNTWLLEQRFGWQGICAEPNPDFFKKLTVNRTCKCSNQYIGRNTGDAVEFILAGVFGSSKEFAAQDQHKEKREAYEQAGHTIKFVSISLDDFLTQHNAPRDIDYLSVDTEGSEYDLLSTFPFEKWNIRFITVEHNFTPQRAQIRTLLEKHGYRCTEQQWDDWYEKAAWLESATDR